MCCGSGCSGSCSGGSSNGSSGCSCSGGCSSGCNSGCRGGCTGHCSGCSGGCYGCRDSCNSCTAACTNSCQYRCDTGCTSCTGNCNNACSNNAAINFLSFQLSEIIKGDELKDIQSYLTKELTRRSISCTANNYDYQNIITPEFTNKLFNDFRLLGLTLANVNENNIIVKDDYEKGLQLLKQKMAECVV